jgi:microcystin-dependent protein
MTIYIIILLVVFAILLLTHEKLKSNYLLYLLGIVLASIAIVIIFSNNYSTTYWPVQMGGDSSDEAIKNIASIYNGNKMIVKDLQITGSLNVLPEGIIAAWQGKSAPDGWVMCDGKNGTPDLRGKFIYGYGDDDDKLGDTGGEKTHKLTVDEMPSHNHKMTSNADDNGNCGKGKDCGFKPTEEISSSDGRIDDSRPIPNSVTDMKKTGGDKSHNNMPPYYILAYIMKK